MCCRGVELSSAIAKAWKVRFGPKAGACKVADVKSSRDFQAPARSLRAS